MYTGRHHASVAADVDRLRAEFPSSRVDLTVISAGYGVLREDDVIVPYDATFVGLPKAEVVRRARDLRIREVLSRRLQSYASGVFLLSRVYLQAIEGVIGAAPQEIYLSSVPVSLQEGIVVVQAGQRQAKALGVSPRLVIAAIFRKFIDQILDSGWEVTVGSLRSGKFSSELESRGESS
jgi:hypothetical protein